MLEHHAKLFYYATRKLYSLQVDITKAIQERGGDSLPNDEEATATRELVRRIEKEAEGLQFSRVLERLDDFNTDSESLQPLDGSGFTLYRLHFQLEELHKDIQRAFGRTKFLMIPAGEASYFNLKHPFGEAVYNNFPSARHDVREARNCYALDRHTACVFHLMRALEHPLRALANELGVPPPARKPQTPMELLTWGDVIAGIIKAINARPNPKSTQEAVLAELYNSAAEQFQFFKDAWRDVVMHSRNRPYGAGEAKDLIMSVETFMRRLADGGLKE